MKKTAFLVVCLIVIVMSVQAQSWWGTGIKGEGPAVKKELNLSSFDGIGLALSGNVYLKQGSNFSVTVEGQQNIIDNLETPIENGMLKIKFDKPVRQHDKLDFYITMPTLKAAKISGSGDIIGETKFSGLSKLEVSISGAGNIKLDVEAMEVNSSISGSGDIHLKGTSNAVAVGIAGSGDVEAIGLVAQNCNVRISGSGNVEVNVSGQLEASIAGSGDVYYHGNPRVKAKVAGSGSVMSR